MAFSKRRFSTTTSSCRRRRPFPHDRMKCSWTAAVVVLLLCAVSMAAAFVPFPSNTRSAVAAATETCGRLRHPTSATTPPPISTSPSASSSSSSTALGVWWFGGTEQSDNRNNDGDSCELVAVRIERTSPNSRRIAGEISVPAPLDAVWNILTDYDRLAIHVPNLMESRVVRENSGGRPGDGLYKCRLYQVGSQKIIGFDFSASVTMDMSERIIASAATPARRIGFKCVDSQFFSEFDGAWTVKEQINPATREVETLCSYVVDVRPKGPVPVAALEWRIREDVPTNLRAVKAATLGMNSASSTAIPTIATKKTDSAALRTDASSQRRSKNTTPRQVPVRVAENADAASSQNSRVPVPRLASVMMDWDVDETMGKYL